MRRSARASSPGAKGWRWSACCWPACCRSTLGPARHQRGAGAARWRWAGGAAPRAARAGRRCAAAQAAPMRLALANAGVPPPADGLPGQRHRQRDPGHAGAVLHPRPPAGPGLRAAVPGRLLRWPRRCRCRCGCARWRASAWRAAGWPACCWPSPASPGPRGWAPATWLGFAAVCVASGVALGADLSAARRAAGRRDPRAGHRGRAEGAYFGWWNFATKLNLALAAGLALPLLGLFGYAPGSRDAGALDALTLAYCAAALRAEAGRRRAAVRALDAQPGRIDRMTTLAPGRRRGRCC